MNKKWKVVITDILDAPPDVEQEALGDDVEIIVLKATATDQLVGQIENAHVVMVWQGLQWDSEVLGKLQNAKGIVRVGAGYDNVDLQVARSLGLDVSNVPDYGTHDVADHTIALMLAIARGVPGSNREAKLGSQHWCWGEVPTFRLTGKRLGIVGLGRIGAAVAVRAKALGMAVAFYDPHLPSGWEKSLGIHRFHDLCELAAHSRIISLHTPLTKETEGMISETFFAALNEPIVLINTGRGAVIDWPSFVRAFREGLVEAAGLDVLPTEPPDFDDELLRAWSDDEKSVRDRLIITPHAAYYSEEAFRELRRKAAEEALRMLKGERLLNCLN